MNWPHIMVTSVPREVSWLSSWQAMHVQGMYVDSLTEFQHNDRRELQVEYSHRE